MRFPEAQMVLKRVINVIMINFLQLLMCVHECSSAAIGTAVQVLLCESFGLWGDYTSVPVTEMYMQSCTATKGLLNQV